VRYFKVHYIKCPDDLYRAYTLAQFISTGVQYVHWVMHKCIVVKVGGKQNTHKVCKKQVNFSKTEGKFFKVGGNILKQGK